MFPPGADPPVTPRMGWLPPPHSPLGDNAPRGRFAPPAGLRWCTGAVMLSL
jgi:hypothetical protein